MSDCRGAVEQINDLEHKLAGLLYQKHVSQVLRTELSPDIRERESRIKQAILAGLRHLEERVKIYLIAYSHDLSRDSCDLPPDSAITEVYLEDYMMQCFREKHQSLKQYPSKGQDDDSRTSSDLHRFVLRTHHPQLLQGLNLHGTTLLDSLIQANLMSEDDRESIIAHKTSRRQNESFLNMLRGQFTFGAFREKFIPALREDHPHLAESIELALEEGHGSYEKDKRCMFCQMKDRVDLKNVAEHLFQKGNITQSLYNDLRSQSVSSYDKWKAFTNQAINVDDIFDALKDKYPDLWEHTRSDSKKCLECCCGNQSESLEIQEVCHIEITDVGMLSDLESLLGDNDRPAYRMMSRPRGMALVISNEKADPNQDFRCHYAEDVRKLQHLFEDMGFSIINFENLSKMQILKELKRLSRVDHSVYDAFLCVIHSEIDKKNSDCVLDINGQTLSTSQITSLFTATSCPSLAGKPKIFLFPGGVTGKYQKGMIVNEDQEIEGNGFKKMTVPDEADFVIAKATVPGYTTWDNPEKQWKGTEYVKTLVHILDRYSGSWDLLTCLRRVNEEMSRLEAKRTDVHREVVFKQIPWASFTLRKPLFLPKATS